MDVKEWLGEDNKLGQDIWEKKYRAGDETFEEWLDRVSGGNKRVRKLIEEKKFLFGGRILAGRGLEKSGKHVTLSNCFVLPAVEDSIEDIFETAKQMARTYSYGGGVGLSLGKLAPRGAKVHNAAKSTSGAVSWMDLFSTTTGLVGQEGRRGALILTMPCDHPDIEEFIDVKKDLDKVTKANISVQITDDFMRRAQNNEDYVATFTREATGETITKTLNARKLFDKLVANNHEMAEPGMLFWDRIQNWHLQSEDKEYVISGVNPCSEEPLPEFGSCLLGSINLSEYVKDKDIDWVTFRSDIYTVVEAMNEVLDETAPLHPLEQQRQVAHDWRNIGIGIMGLADTLIKMEVKYGSAESLDVCKVIAEELASTSINASALLAEQDGAFPKCKTELILNSPFFKNIVEKQANNILRTNVENYGLRNCALLTIPPTGTLSSMLGISGGLEPIFSNTYTRKTESLNGSGDPVYYKVYTPIVKKYMEEHNITDEKDLPDYFVTAHDIKPIDRIKMQSTWQEFIDASISSTVNLPNDATVDNVADIYMNAWEYGLKGVTVFRDGCARQGILTTGKAEEKPNEPMTIRDLPRGCVIKTSDDGLIGKKKTLKVGCGSLHVQAWFDNETGDLLETFLDKGSTGGCMSFMCGLSRQISLAARGGVCVDQIVDQLESTIPCPSYVTRTATKHDTSPGTSCPQAIGRALKQMHKEVLQELGIEDEQVAVPIVKQSDIHDAGNKPKCPECGAELIFEGGCNTCKNCGWSKCS